MHEKSTFLRKIFEIKEEKPNLDFFAFLLDENSRIGNLGRTVQTSSGRMIENYNGDDIFFNSVKHASGHVYLTGDTLSSAKQNEEQIVVKLNALDEKYHRIIF